MRSGLPASTAANKGSAKRTIMRHVVQTIDRHLFAIFVRPGRAFLRALLEVRLYLAGRGLEAVGPHRIQQALAGFLDRRAPRFPFRRFGWPDIDDLPILQPQVDDVRRPRPGWQGEEATRFRGNVVAEKDRFGRHRERARLRFVPQPTVPDSPVVGHIQATQIGFGLQPGGA